MSLNPTPGPWQRSLTEKLASFVRPELTEEYSVSVDGGGRISSSRNAHPPERFGGLQ